MSDVDLTGRSRLFRNIGTSYASQLVFFIFGFILPRTIDETIGQVGLGIWDFGWTFVNYLNMAMLGIGSSVNRFVSKFRAAGDAEALSRTVSTVVAIQLTISTLVLIAVLALAYWVPILMAERLGEYADDARWVIAFLGSALAVQMAFDVWRGVISGCHRWDYYNALNAGGYTVSSIVMILVLIGGGGLRGIAVVYLVVTLITELTRFVVARRVCPEVNLSWSSVNWADAKIVTKFGGKTLLLGYSPMIAIQTVNVLITVHLGPAALAILARPLALTRAAGMLVTKFANILTPTAGSLQSQGAVEELRTFAIDTARAGWLVAIPPLVTMGIVGDWLVDLWMGPGYANWSTTTVLAFGMLLPISQRPLLQVMLGMDAHGKLAKVTVAAMIISLLIGVTILGSIGWTTTRGAFLIIVPPLVGHGIAVLIYGLKVLRISVLEYLRDVMRDAVLLFVVLAAGLFALRQIAPGPLLLDLALAALLNVVVIMALLRKDILSLIARIRSG
jgi:O-antigen/teichoic acid export membrane protein